MGNVQQYIGKRVEVGRYDVEVVKYLGEGGSSFIFLVKDASRGHMVLKRLVAENETMYEWIHNEIQMHQRFGKQANVVEFIASQTNRLRGDQREVFILMEYCPNGHLYENMVKMGERRFAELELLRLFKSLCMPVAVLHHEDPPIAHRDIKLENFLKAKNGNYKLCDFGSCVEGTQSLVSKQDRLRQMDLVLKRTTAMYRSPELADIEGTAMFGSGELTEAVDIWALGCVLFTMAYFKPPFPPEGLRTERYTIPSAPKYSKGLETLIARMLTGDVERRATIDHVLKCVDALLENRVLPPLARSTASQPSPRKGTKSIASTSGASQAKASKTGEARREAIPSATASPDLLDLDFNPSISKPVTKTMASQISCATTQGNFQDSSLSWTTATPEGGFADFASFPSSQIPAMATSLTPSAQKVDAFGFPLSPSAVPAAATMQFNDPFAQFEASAQPGSRFPANTPNTAPPAPQVRPAGSFNPFYTPEFSNKSPYSQSQQPWG